MNEKINLQDLVNLFCEKQGLNKKEAESLQKKAKRSAAAAKKAAAMAAAKKKK